MCENCCCLGELSLTDYEVSLEMMHTESSEQKDRTWLFELYLRVGQRIYRMSVYSVVLMGIVYRLRC